MAAIGATSPTVPAASTMRPKKVSSRPPSRRSGSSTPSPVVLTARTTIIGASTPGTMCSNPTTATPSSSEMPQPPSASDSGRPFIAPKSSSNPAMLKFASEPSRLAWIKSSMSGWSQRIIPICAPRRAPADSSVSQLLSNTRMLRTLLCASLVAASIQRGLPKRLVDSPTP